MLISLGQVLLVSGGAGLAVGFFIWTLLHAPAVRQARRAGRLAGWVEKKFASRLWPSLSPEAEAWWRQIYHEQRVRWFRKRFVAQLPDALDALVAALRAGYALPFSLALVARETQGLAQEVFAALARADQYQIPLRTAVERVCAQLRFAEWDLVAQTLEIQEFSGGNIIPVLEELARTLRDKLRIDQEVSTATASGRFSGLLIAALAPVSLLGFLIFSPSYLSVLLHTELGHLLLALAILLEIVGFAVIWKMVTIEY